MTLEQFIAEFGITTYEMLVIRCDRMGVNSPTDDVFRAIVGTKVVSSPTEGVVVLEALPVTDEEMEDQTVVEEPVISLDETPKSKRRRKAEPQFKE